MTNNGSAVLGGQFLEDVLEHANVVQPGMAQPTGFMTLNDFMGMNFKQEWLIEYVLVQRQPTILGGPKKALKTSLLVDLEVSLASGRPFLNHKQFKVSEPLRAGLISGESGGATLQDTFKRVCAAKGILEPGELPAYCSLQLPQLSNAKDLERLHDTIRAHKLKVVVLDPLYLALLSGNSKLQASNLYEVGPLLAGVAKACSQAGAMVILAHHTRMHSQAAKKVFNGFGPLELDDLAFAGVQEFARQWLLVSRREKYEPGTGHHPLWLNIGGSAGHSNCYAVDVEEGVLGVDFKGRKWEVTVRTATQEYEAVKLQSAAAKEAKQHDQDCVDGMKVREALTSGPNTQAGIVETSGLQKARVKHLLDQLTASGIVKACMVPKNAGQAGSRPYPGYQLITAAAT